MTTNKRIGSQFYSISWAEPNSLAFAYPKKNTPKDEYRKHFWTFALQIINAQYSVMREIRLNNKELPYCFLPQLKAIFRRRTFPPTFTSHSANFLFVSLFHEPLISQYAVASATRPSCPGYSQFLGFNYRVDYWISKDWLASTPTLTWILAHRAVYCSTPGD